MRKFNAIHISEETAPAAMGLMPAEIEREEGSGTAPTVFNKISEWVKKIKIPPFPWKKINLKNALVASCLVLVAVAGFLNVRYGLLSREETPVSQPNAGSAENKENAGDHFFTSAVIDRERVRDEALEVLVGITEDETATETAKTDAFAAMERIARETSAEIDIENLVKSKGFAECVAVISGEDANIVVRSNGLTAGEVAQIKEIVYLEANILPKNVRIIERAEGQG